MIITIWRLCFAKRRNEQGRFKESDIRKMWDKRQKA